MNLLTSLVRKRAVDASAFLTSDGLLPGAGASGISVTHESALRTIAVYACVGIIADALMGMPIRQIRRNADGTRETLDPPLWLDPDWAPNPETDRETFVHRWANSLLLHGTAYSLITSRARGFPSEVWNLAPDEVRPDRSRGRLEYVWGDRRLVPYTVSNPGGEIMVTKGFDFGGDVGVDPIRKVAFESIGLAAAAERYGATFFGQGQQPSGVIEMDGNPSPEAIKTITGNWVRHHAGVSKSHLPGMLIGGAKWRPTSIPPDSAQFIETRKYQIGETARLYRVPPHLISDVERSTSWGTGIEEQNIGFVKFTLLPWIIRFESMASSTVPARHRIKLVTAGLERGSLKSRFDAYAVGRNWGWLSQDDVRALEDMNPIGAAKGGDVYHIPLNMAASNAEQILEGPSPSEAANGQVVAAERKEA